MNGVSVNIHHRTSPLTPKRALAALAVCGLLMGFTPLAKDANAGTKPSSTSKTSSSTTTYNGDGRKN
jgi:hypothetical protein